MDTSETTALLTSVDLFEGLAPKVLKRIATSAEIAEFAQGTAVMSQGDKVAGYKAFSAEGVKMHVVVHGSATVRVNGEPVAALGPGEYFGELSLIDGLPRSADVVAGEPGLTTLALSNWAFAGLLEDHPEVAVPMLRVLCARLRRVEAASAATES